MRTLCLAAVWFVLTLVVGSPARAQQPDAPATQRLGRAIRVGALTGAAGGAVAGAWWATRMGDGATPLTGAGLLGAVGAASGAMTGVTNALLPRRRGWRQVVQGAVVGMAFSGLAFWTIGEWNGKVGPWHPDDFRNIGLGHGAITGVFVVRFAP